MIVVAAKAQGVAHPVLRKVIKKIRKRRKNIKTIKVSKIKKQRYPKMEIK